MFGPGKELFYNSGQYSATVGPVNNHNTSPGGLIIQWGIKSSFQESLKYKKFGSSNLKCQCGTGILTYEA